MTAKETNMQTQKGNRILIVDDCDVNQALLQQYLERAGYAVEIAENGRRALEALECRQFDLILMDLVMPVMDGYEAARRIRKAECGMRNNEIENSEIKSEIPGPDHKCECRVDKDQPAKHPCSEKDCKCRRARTGQNVNRAIVPRDDGGPKSEIHNYKSEIRNPKSEIEAVPIIGMSGHDPQSVLEACCRAGMNDCVGKPLQRKSLLSVVRKWTAGDSDIPQSKMTKNELSQSHSDTIENQPPIDIEKTITEFQGKTDLLLEILKTFKVRVRAQIMNIKQHLSVNNYNPILSEAHAIKGGAGNLGAFKLSRAAAGLEEAAGEASSAKANAATDDLEKEFHRLCQYLEQSDMGKAI